MTDDQELADRRELARRRVPKTSRFPRTERRRQRVEDVLRRRQPDLTIVLENGHDPHNVSAVLRSCDAVGILRVHVVYSIESPPERAFARTTSASAAKWVDVVPHASIEACYGCLRAEGFTVVAAALREGSTDLYDLDLTRPTALVFGNEMRGLTDEACDGADTIMSIPMVGMVRSLNISVSCAVALYEAFRQRRRVGWYDSARLELGEISTLVDEWLTR